MSVGNLTKVFIFKLAISLCIQLFIFSELDFSNGKIEDFSPVWQPALKFLMLLHSTCVSQASSRIVVAQNV